MVLNTGDGKGKSSAAFGVMLRALARDWKVAVVQFVKSGKWHVGEEEMGRRLGVDWLAVGDGFTWDSKNLEHDQALARTGWEQAAELIAAGTHRLVILDELTYLCTWGWLDVDDVVAAIRDRPADVQRGDHRARRAAGAGRARRHGRRRCERSSTPTGRGSRHFAALTTEWPRSPRSRC